MNCNNVEEHLIDYIEGSLSKKEMADLSKHIATCEPCKLLHENTKSLLKSLAETPKAEPSSNLRPAFYNMLEEEKQLQAKVIPLNAHNSLSWKTAFQIAASILLLVSGYFMGSFTEGQNTKKEITSLLMETKTMKQNMTLAMMDNRSPSKRIMAVSYTEEMTSPDDKILKALIDRLQFDANSNVRLAATEALAKYTASELVKTALIKTLSTEKDPSIQIEIIQILANIKEKRALDPMKKLLEHPDTPDYVKDQATVGISRLI